MRKIHLYAAFACLALAPLAYAKKDMVLPDACGDDKTEFKVNLTDNRPELKPQDGKALLVIEEEGLSKHFDLTTRYGIDGTWIGATHGSSYFLVQLTPGEHHLCAAPQKHGAFNETMREHLISMTTFTAEEGKIYFFGGKESATGSPGSSVYVPPAPGSSAPGQFASSPGSRTLIVNYGFLSDDEGKYRVKAGRVATWTIK